MAQQKELFASFGSRCYSLRFVDDDAQYVEIEIASDLPTPLPAQRHRVIRDSVLNRFEHGTTRRSTRSCRSISEGTQ
jgi:hypothetical protein